MIKKDDIIAKNFKKPEELPHITAEEFCENLDDVLEKVAKEKIAYVITKKEKNDLVVCPIEWFDVRFDEDFQLIVLSAVRYCFRRDTYMPSVAIDFIRRNIHCMTEKTIDLLIRDTSEELKKEPLFGCFPQKELWEQFLVELIDYKNKNGDKK